MSAVGTVGTVVPMAQAGDSADALAAARRSLAARDADLADADRALAATVADAHAIAVQSISRLAAISDDIEAAAADQPTDTPAAAREIARNLVARNREIAEVVSEARELTRAKTLALKELAERYRPRG